MPLTSASSRPWWHTAVVYQVYPRSFADGNGDGIGDLPGLIDRLDHIAALGADVVWVCPFYPSPQADNGYDVRDYCGVDPLFGTVADVDRLIAALHRRGMRLVIDVVVNHTSDEHPWFVASRESRGDPRRDWYVWRPPRAGLALGAPGAEPTDWVSFFGGSTWEPDERTGEYYLHLFHPKQPDLNWDNPVVRAEVRDVLRWWLDRGVDGFRFDVINLVSKWYAADGAQGGGFVNGPRVHEYLHEMAQVWAGRQPAVLAIGETPRASVEDARRYTDPARGELDMVFQFEHMHVDHGPGGRFDLAPMDLVAFKAVMARWQEGLSQVGWNSLYWGNHDQPRPVSRFGDDRPAYRVASAKALATVLHLHRGTPFVYQGEELGMANHPFTAVEQIDDVESRRWADGARRRGMDETAVLASLNRRSRDHARTPMPWDAGPAAGFTTGRPWLPLNPDAGQVNAAAQVGIAGSVFEHYRALVALRKALPVLVDGDFTLLAPEHPSGYAFLRRSAGDALLVAANLSSDEIELPLPEMWADAPVVLGSGMPGVPPGRGPWGRLGPWEAWVRRR
ncbi:MAG: alpha-glucosidase [Dermatophilaceae bacterium]